MLGTTYNIQTWSIAILIKRHRQVFEKLFLSHISKRISDNVNSVCPSKYVQKSKDKLEDMDVSLFASAHMGPWFSLGHCDPTSGHISNPRVSYERYGYHLSIDTFCFIVGWVVWSQRIVKVEYFLTFFRKAEFFTSCWKQIFENFFSNCSHLKTIWWKILKPTGNSHKYPKFSYAERSSQKY